MAGCAPTATAASEEPKDFARPGEDTKEDVATFDQVYEQAMGTADELAEGIAAQFPNRIRRAARGAVAGIPGGLAGHGPPGRLAGPWLTVFRASTILRLPSGRARRG